MNAPFRNANLTRIQYLNAGGNVSAINGTNFYKVMCGLSYPGISSANVSFDSNCDRIGYVFALLLEIRIRY